MYTSFFGHCNPCDCNAPTYCKYIYWRATNHHRTNTLLALHLHHKWLRRKRFSYSSFFKYWVWHNYVWSVRIGWWLLVRTFLMDTIGGLPKYLLPHGVDNILTTQRLDPIVTPGKVSTHVHSGECRVSYVPFTSYLAIDLSLVLGGSGFGLNVNTSILQESECTSIPIQEDKSNYWFPASSSLARSAYRQFNAHTQTAAVFSVSVVFK